MKKKDRLPKIEHGITGQKKKKPKSNKKNPRMKKRPKITCKKKVTKNLQKKNLEEKHK